MGASKEKLLKKLCDFFNWLTKHQTIMCIICLVLLLICMGIDVAQKGYYPKCFKDLFTYVVDMVQKGYYPKWLEDLFVDVADIVKKNYHPKWLRDFFEYKIEHVISIVVVMWTFTVSLSVYCLGKFGSQYYGISIKDILIFDLKRRNIAALIGITLIDLFFLIFAAILELQITIVMVAAQQFFIMFYSFIFVCIKTSLSYFLEQIKMETKEYIEKLANQINRKIEIKNCIISDIKELVNQIKIEMKDYIRVDVEKLINQVVIQVKIYIRSDIEKSVSQIGIQMKNYIKADLEKSISQIGIRVEEPIRSDLKELANQVDIQTKKCVPNLEKLVKQIGIQTEEYIKADLENLVKQIEIEIEQYIGLNLEDLVRQIEIEVEEFIKQIKTEEYITSCFIFTKQTKFIKQTKMKIKKCIRLDLEKLVKQTEIKIKGYPRLGLEELLNQVKMEIEEYIRSDSGNLINQVKIEIKKSIRFNLEKWIKYEKNGTVKESILFKMAQNFNYSDNHNREALLEVLRVSIDTFAEIIQTVEKSEDNQNKEEFLLKLQKMIVIFNREIMMIIIRAIKKTENILDFLYSYTDIENLMFEAKLGIIASLLEDLTMKNVNIYQSLIDIELEHQRDLQVWVVVYNVYQQQNIGEEWRIIYIEQLFRMLYQNWSRKDTEMALRYWEYIYDKQARIYTPLFKYIF